MGFVNAIVVGADPDPAARPRRLDHRPGGALLGAAVGAVNGFLAAYVRIQPIVATLGTYLILVGVTLTILPAPIGTVRRPG